MKVIPAALFSGNDERFWILIDLIKINIFIHILTLWCAIFEIFLYDMNNQIFLEFIYRSRRNHKQIHYFFIPCGTGFDLYWIDYTFYLWRYFICKNYFFLPIDGAKLQLFLSYFISFFRDFLQHFKATFGRKIFTLQPETPYDFIDEYEPLGDRSKYWWWVNEFDYKQGQHGTATRSFRIPGSWENYHCSTMINGTIWHANPHGIMKLGRCGFEKIDFFDAADSSRKFLGTSSNPACTGNRAGDKMIVTVAGSKVHQVFDLQNFTFWDTQPCQVKVTCFATTTLESGLYKDQLHCSLLSNFPKFLGFLFFQ